MFTEVRRIDLTQAKDLAKEIANLCDNMLAGQFQLASTFVYNTQLVLIFQKAA